MSVRFWWSLILLAAMSSWTAAAVPLRHLNSADFVFRGGAVYTMEPQQPWASAVVVRDGRIAAVLSDDADAEPYVGDSTRVIELEGRMLVPGFIDGHTHFERAGALLNDANLLPIADEQGLRRELARVVGELEAGEWITGGLWGAYESWKLGSSGKEENTRETERWRPHRSMIDDLTPQHPVFLRSFDRDPATRLHLANTLALKETGLLENPVPGMELDADGTPTGLLLPGSRAIGKLQLAVKPKSAKRLLNETRAALRVLRESGVVEIHDITGDAQMERFVELETLGELTARVWLRADLSRAREFNQRGIKMGTHPQTGARDRFLRWGAYKGYIDGIMGNHTALFFEPYDDQPENFGRYRPHTSNDPEHLLPDMDKMYRYLVEAADGGFVANVHAIGTKGVTLMLDTYERLQLERGALDGYRVIHAQVIRPEDFPRFERLGVIAEVNPYHLSDDMRWMEERIGRERCQGAYAFRSLIDHGATLVFGSDWPGTNAAQYHVHPRYLLHAAVNRTTLDHTPEGGWFPEQKISLHEALKAYTIHGAKATFDAEHRGSIKTGKVADLVVIDRNLFEIDPERILAMNVDLTMVDGKVVFERGSRPSGPESR